MTRPDAFNPLIRAAATVAGVAAVMLLTAAAAMALVGLSRELTTIVVVAGIVIAMGLATAALSEE